MKLRLAIALTSCLLLALIPTRGEANFHLWFVKEVYTNPSGNVQFVELFTTSPGQEVLNGKTLTASANSHTFTFGSNSPTPTDSHHLLLATANFNQIPGGATPDYIIPSNFFSTSGDTLNFAGGFDIKTFASIPTDGVNSLNYTGQFSGSTTAVNSPRNYLAAGSTLGTGDYNSNHSVDAADYILWRKTFNQTASPQGKGADGNFSGTVDAGDYTYWRARYGNTGAGSGALVGGSIPEPATLVGSLVGPLLLAAGRFRIRGSGTKYNFNTRAR
jgi:hypothetical protein